MSAIVFAGPSLWGAAVGDVPGIEFRPPAACGDVLRAAREGPRAIGLIDGLFETGPSVWHKEILDALACGVAVAGAASLGAIRAAELHGFGMTGVGRVFARYRDGRLDRDDAVMVSHAPAELRYRPLTVALVDLDAATARWPAADRAAMAGIASSINFRDRTWEVLDAAFRRRTGRAMPPADRDASVKRDDAMMLVGLLAGGIAAPSEPCRPPPQTPWLRALKRAADGG